ncbi:hypothetical protein JCM8097_003373 [Rhodosporidiobolus ruineniae]
MLSRQALAVARAPLASRSLATTAARRADVHSPSPIQRHPNTSSAIGGDVKPTAWADRRTQAKSILPLWAWFVVLGTFGTAAAYKWSGSVQSRSERRFGTIPPEEIGATPTADGRPPKPSTYVGGKGE